MTVKIGGIHATIGADSTKFEAALKRADIALASSQARMNRALAGVERGFNRLTRPLQNIVGEVFSLRGAFAALAGGVSIQGLKTMLDSLGGLGELAEQLGVTTDGLQAYQYAATQVGVTQETLNRSIQRFTQTIGDAAQGEKEALDAFNDLGVRILDGAGKVRDTETVLSDVAEALARIEDPARRASLAADLFGRAGQKLLPMLSGGAAGLQRFRDEAARLGLVISAEKIQNADLLADRLAALQLRIYKLGESIAPDLFDNIDKLISFINGDAITGEGHLADVLRNTRKEIEYIGKLIKSGAWFNLTDFVDQRSDLEKAVARLQEMESTLRAAGAAGRDLTLSPKFMADLEEARRRVEQLSAADRQAGFEQDEAAARRDRLPAVTAPGVKNPLPRDESNREKDRLELENYIASLRQAADMAALENEQREIAEAILKAEAIARKQVNEGLRESAELTTQEIVDIRSSIELKQKNERVERENQAARAEGKRLIEELRTPAEAYAMSLERINELLRLGVIGETTAARAREQAKQTFEQADEGARAAKEASDQLAISFTSAFEEAVIGGGDLRDIFQGLIEDIIKMIIQLYILGPLLKAIKKELDGVLGGILGGGSGGGVNIFTSSAGGTSWIDGYLGFASGGSFRVGGSGGTDSQFVGFNATPGEMVDIRTPGQDRGGAVTVNVINNSGEKTQTREGTGPNGERLLEIVIGKVEQGLRTPGSRLHSAITQNFGARQVLGTR